MIDVAVQSGRKHGHLKGILYLYSYIKTFSVIAINILYNEINKYIYFHS